MKKLLVGGFALAAMVTVLHVNAQSGYRKSQTQQKPNTADTGKNKPATQPVQQPAANPASTQPQAVGNANTAPAATVRYDTTGGFDTKAEISLRNNSAVDRSQVKDRKPLEYEHLRDDDNLWSEFLWREIDAREKINQSFMYPGKDQNGEDQRFYSVLLQAIKNDSVTAFAPENDRFTKPLTMEKVMDLSAGINDTVEVPDPVTNTVEKIITKKPRFSPDSVYTFRIKEQVIFDKEASRLFTRIIGIAPIAKEVVAGKSVPRLLFWVYYPDLRKTLAKVDVYNPKNFSSRMTWEELFEGRYFSSYIIKSSANNPGDKYLNAMIKDPLFRLLEGENIKTRIFNWEQDLWQY
ncbi:MAG: gliding motility protein GldN [Chitinophagaceae bacterium]|nr:gliding motility protein GldN [Chitinophagaceae bacterium]